MVGEVFGEIGILMVVGVFFHGCWVFFTVLGFFLMVSGFFMGVIEISTM